MSGNQVIDRLMTQAVTAHLSAETLYGLGDEIGTTHQVILTGMFGLSAWLVVFDDAFVATLLKTPLCSESSYESIIRERLAYHQTAVVHWQSVYQDALEMYQALIGFLVPVDERDVLKLLIRSQEMLEQIRFCLI